MRTMTVEINVDELVKSGAFVASSNSTAEITSFGGAVRLTATKSGNLMKLASLLQEAAVKLMAQQQSNPDAPTETP